MLQKWYCPGSFNLWRLHLATACSYLLNTKFLPKGTIPFGNNTEHRFLSFRHLHLGKSIYFPSRSCAEDKHLEKISLPSSVYACVHILHLYRQPGWIDTYVFYNHNRGPPDYLFLFIRNLERPNFTFFVHFLIELRLKAIPSSIWLILRFMSPFWDIKDVAGLNLSFLPYRWPEPFVGTKPIFTQVTKKRGV